MTRAVPILLLLCVMAAVAPASRGSDGRNVTETQRKFGTAPLAQPLTWNFGLATANYERRKEGAKLVKPQLASSTKRRLSRASLWRGPNL